MSAPIIPFPASGSRPRGAPPPQAEVASLTLEEALLLLFRGAELDARVRALAILRQSAIVDQVELMGEQYCRGRGRSFWRAAPGAHTRLKGRVFTDVAEIKRVALAYLQDLAGDAGAAQEARFARMTGPDWCYVQAGRWRVNVFGLPPRIVRVWGPEEQTEKPGA